MRRRWPRRLVLGVVALVALAALRIVLGKSLGDRVAASERARFEREVGALDPARLETPTVPPGQNAAPAIAAAVARIELTPAERARLDAWESGGATAADGIDALLGVRSALLADLVAAARRPQSSFGPRVELFHGARVDFATWLRAARLLRADGERALDGGDAGRAGAALDGLAGMAVALRREPIAVFGVTGAAVENLWLDLVRLHIARGVAVPGDPTADLERLAALPDAFGVIHGEAVLGHDMLRRAPLATRPAASARERIEALLWPWSEGHVEAGYLAGWAKVAKLARLPQSGWPTAGELAADPDRLRRWIDPTVPYATVRAALMPNLLAIARKLQLLAASEQLARLALAVATARDAEGVLPETLAGLPGAETPDAAAASLPTYLLSADTSAEITLPAALALLDPREGSPRVAHRRERLLCWEIPAAREL